MSQVDRGAQERLSEEFSEYWEKLSSECLANFSGTSQAMESSAALEILSRSVSNHSLSYTSYVGYPERRMSWTYTEKPKKTSQKSSYENFDFHANSHFKG